MENIKVRQSNFELLRIISMAMIVAMHYLGKGGALSEAKPFQINFIISHIIQALSIVATNCYIMISGYFLIKSKFSFKKIIRLWLQVIFYSLGIYIVLLIIGVEDFSVKTLLQVSLPITLKEYWFISGYMALMFLYPFINIGIKALSKRQLELLIITVLSLIVWSNVVPSGFLFINHGYSLTHFIFIYILSAYVRLYWDYKINKYVFLVGYLVCALGITGIIIPLYMIGRIDLWQSIVGDYSFVGVVIESFCLFMFIKDINIKSKFINKIAPLTLSVYLIHMQFSIRDFLFKDMLHTDKYVNSNLFILHFLVSVLSIFIVCICIDAMRKWLFDFIEERFIKNNKNILEKSI